MPIDYLRELVAIKCRRHGIYPMFKAAMRFASTVSLDAMILVKMMDAVSVVTLPHGIHLAFPNVWERTLGEYIGVVIVFDTALADISLCQLHKFYVMPRIVKGGLEALPDGVCANDEPIWAVYPQRRHLLPKVRNPLDRLRVWLVSQWVGPGAGCRPSQTPNCH